MCKFLRNCLQKNFGSTNFCANIFANICANFWGKKYLCKYSQKNLQKKLRKFSMDPTSYIDVTFLPKLVARCALLHPFCILRQVCRSGCAEHCFLRHLPNFPTCPVTSTAAGTLTSSLFFLVPDCGARPMPSLMYQLIIKSRRIYFRFSLGLYIPYQG